jgi:hypothetical protein
MLNYGATNMVATQKDQPPSLVKEETTFPKHINCFVRNKIWSFVPTMPETKTRHLATGSEGEAGDRSYVWEARRFSVTPFDKPLDWRVVKREAGFPMDFKK